MSIVQHLHGSTAEPVKYQTRAKAMDVRFSLRYYWCLVSIHVTKESLPYIGEIQYSQQ
jgi:hypothetical protein